MGKPSDGSRQIEESQGAPDFARETGAPPEVKQMERDSARNTLDPAGGKGKDPSDGGGRS